MQIRHERDSDFPLITDLVYVAFTDHPQHAPGAEPTEHMIVLRLRAAGALALSLVADDAGEIVGHIAFSEVLLDGRQSAGWYGIGPVAVHPSRQRKGIGSALIRAGIAELQSHGAHGIALVGDPEYYVRFGFKPDPDLILAGVPPEYFLILPLVEPKATGTVSFHAAFGV